MQWMHARPAGIRRMRMALASMPLIGRSLRCLSSGVVTRPKRISECGATLMAINGHEPADSQQG